MNTNQVIYIIGVSGVGKSTIGHLLSQTIHVPFFDADDYHSDANLKKMTQGHPLNDDDRFGWLQALNALAKEQIKNNSCIIACSALKISYRDLLSKGIHDKVKWIFLHGTFEQIEERISLRRDHFMKSDLLKSQLDILEKPKQAINIDISLKPEKIVNIIRKGIVEKSDFGLFGLGVMGKSLSRNLANNGFKLSLFNRHLEGVEENVAVDFVNEFKELASSLPFDDIELFVSSLQTPRKIMLMVNSGKIIDMVIEDLLPFLSDGDILIDGGNSNYNQTKERFNNLKSKNIHFIGSGVSGGEEGALRGPSIMPGGDKNAYLQVQSFLEAIAAKDENNLPCCTFIGPDGSGHFVKMVHNGIEYVEMQLLTEVYTILKSLGNNPSEIANIFESWKSTASSYLMDITIDILRKKEQDHWLLDKILDKAGNKGTGNWAAIASAEFGVPSTLITSALFARYTSFYKDERIAASKVFNICHDLKLDVSNEDILGAYQFSRIINHYQGFKLISEVSKAQDWNLNLSELARIWTSGCIVKSDLMKELVLVFKSTQNVLLHEKIIQQINALRPAVKKVVSECILNDLPIPNLSESINFLNGYSTPSSAANLIQAQRDYFGAHTYQRIDDSTGKYYHTNWKV